MRNIHKDILSGAFLLLLSVGVFIYAFSIPRIFPLEIGSGFVPKVVSALLALLSLIIIGNGFRQQTQQATLQQGGQSVEKKDDINITAVIGTIAAIAVYIFIMGYLGFMVSTMLYLAAQFCILAPLNKKTVPVIAVLSIGLTIVIYLTFEYGFEMLLPSYSL
jgi:putative tricarboxylic transport membrane protein